MVKFAAQKYMELTQMDAFGSSRESHRGLLVGLSVYYLYSVQMLLCVELLYNSHRLQTLISQFRHIFIVKKINEILHYFLFMKQQVTYTSDFKKV